MHPHNASRHGPAGAPGRNSGREGAPPPQSPQQSRGSSHPDPVSGTQPPPSSYPLVSPRPRVSRAVKPTAAVVRHTSTSTTAGTPRRGSLTTTPVRRTTNNSATRTGRDGTPQSRTTRAGVSSTPSTTTVSSARAARRRSTSLTQPPQLHSGRAEAAAVTTPYRAPPTPTAQALGLKPRRVRASASRQSSTSKDGAEVQRGRRGSATAHNEGDEKGHHGGAAGANEPFGESTHQREVAEPTHSTAPPTATTSRTPKAGTRALDIAATRTSASVKTASAQHATEEKATTTDGVAAPRTTKPSPATLIPSSSPLSAINHLSMRARQAEEDATETLIQNLLAAHPLPNASGGASTGSAADGGPRHFYQLPPDGGAAERRRLFNALSYNTCRRHSSSSSSTPWSLHGQVLPFLAAHASAIMAVSTQEMLAYLGDRDALAYLDRAHAGRAERTCDAPPVSATAMARFAAQLCGWFFYVGVLACGERLTWESALGGTRRGASDSALSALVSGSTRSRPMPTTPLRSQPQQHCSAVTPEKGQTQHGGRSASSSSEEEEEESPSYDTSPTGLPRVLRHRSGSAPGTSTNGVAHRGEGGGEEEGDGDDREGTVVWQTAQWERSMAAASSTFASVDFRTVVEVPPFVEVDAFVRGYGVFHALLMGRTASLAQEKCEHGGFLLRLREALRCVDGRWATASGSATRVRLPPHVPPSVRAGLRCVQFYVRLHGFLHRLCLYHRATHVTPSLRDSQIVEAVLRSRLTMTDAATESSHVTGKARTTKRRGAVNGELPLRCGWLGRYLLHRGLHKAIMNTSPAAARGAPEDHANTTAAVDTIDVLLTLRNRVAERIVCSVTGVKDGGVRSAGGASNDLSPRPEDTAAQAAAVSKEEATNPHRTLPVSVLLLFSLPRQTPWRCAGPTSPHPPGTTDTTTAGAAHSGGSTAVALCLFMTTLLLTFAFGPLLYYVVRCVEPDWMPWWDEAFLSVIDAPHTLFVHGVKVHVGPLCRSLGQLLLVTPVLLLTAYLGSRRGATAARIALQHAVVRSQAARLTRLSTTWLYSAWALRTENVVAAAAAQRCVARLALVCRAAEATCTAAAPPRRVSSLALCLSTLSLLVVVLHAVLAPQQTRILIAVHLLLTAAVAWCSVVHGWRCRQRALDWWLQRQVCLAEGFAADVLREVATISGSAMEIDYVAGQTSLTPASPSSPHTAHSLYIVPLHLLEELTKVACLMKLCQSANLRRGGDDAAWKLTLSPCTTVQALEDFPMHCFYEQLCGHAAVAYANNTAAACVVEGVVAACASAAVAAAAAAQLAERNDSLRRSPAEVLLALLLPWVEDSDAESTGGNNDNSGGNYFRSSHTDDVTEGSEDAQVVEVLAPVAATTPAWPAVDAAPTTLKPLSPHAPGGHACSFAEQPMLLDVELRRSPYLTLRQRRLLVCAAVVFAGLRMQPPACSCVTEATLVCLVRLVCSQLSGAPGSAAAKCSLTGRWREAERRTRKALSDVQRVAVTLRLSGDLGDNCDSTSESCYSLLPQLNHVLFA